MESEPNYFGARYYAAIVGRFMSADWSAQVEPVPYAKLEEPQSLNRKRQTKRMDEVFAVQAAGVRSAMC